MKIAFLVDEFPSLSETFVLNQIVGLLERGHEIDVYANRRGKLPWSHSEFSEHDLIKGTFYLEQGIQGMPPNKLLRLLKAFPVMIELWRKGRSGCLASLNIAKYGKQAASLELLYRSAQFSRKIILRHCSLSFRSEWSDRGGLEGTRSV